jgi:predicted RNase H-like HicB family nuclease
MESFSMMPVEVHFKPSGRYWVASCPSLDIATQGETFERAGENLREALWLFFDSCRRRGTLEQVLTEAGYSAGEVATVSEAVKSFTQPPMQPVSEQCRV